MEVDRLCALVDPAMDDEDRSEAARHFVELQRQVNSRTANPSGTGIDLPYWLSRLELEVERVRTIQSNDALLSEGFIETAQVQLSLHDVQQQIKNWAPSKEGT
jgi:hypothetical protein